MGLAWVDDAPTDEGEPDLRFGGRPMLPESQEWPCCPVSGAPMLFRGQVPLALTTLTAFDDDRLLSLFECQSDGRPGTCGEGCGLALVLDGTAVALRNPPASTSFDILLTDFGNDPATLQNTLSALDVRMPRHLPAVLLKNVPPSIAEATVSTLAGVGATAEALGSPPAVLSWFAGGKVVPFEDGFPGARRTTLPPLDFFMQQQPVDSMRGVFGGSQAGYRDHTYRCSCGETTRTAVQLLSCRTSDPRIQLDAAHVQFCIACGRATLHRNPRGTDSRSVESVASR